MFSLKSLTLVGADLSGYEFSFIRGRDGKDGRDGRDGRGRHITQFKGLNVDTYPMLILEGAAIRVQTVNRSNLLELLLQCC